MQRAIGEQLLCILRHGVWGSLGLMRRMRPVRGEPAMVMSDQQARLSGCKRGCRPLDRSVVGDL